MNTPTKLFDPRGAVEAAVEKLQAAQRSIEEGLKLKPKTDADRALIEALKASHKEAVGTELSLRLALMAPKPPEAATLTAA
jgi:hypothetical protein